MKVFLAEASMSSARGWDQQKEGQAAPASRYGSERPLAQTYEFITLKKAYQAVAAICDAVIAGGLTRDLIFTRGTSENNAIRSLAKQTYGRRLIPEASSLSRPPTYDRVGDVIRASLIPLISLAPVETTNKSGTSHWFCAS
ncbi:MAG: hypothetical protein R3C46_09700 [Hyphomonadaceae bacterium]